MITTCTVSLPPSDSISTSHSEISKSTDSLTIRAAHIRQMSRYQQQLWLSGAVEVPSTAVWCHIARDLSLTHLNPPNHLCCKNHTAHDLPLTHPSFLALLTLFRECSNICGSSFIQHLVVSFMQAACTYSLFLFF